MLTRLFFGAAIVMSVCLASAQAQAQAQTQTQTQTGKPLIVLKQSAALLLIDRQAIGPGQAIAAVSPANRPVGEHEVMPSRGDVVQANATRGTTPVRRTATVTFSVPLPPGDLQLSKNDTSFAGLLIAIKAGSQHRMDTRYEAGDAVSARSDLNATFLNSGISNDTLRRPRRSALDTMLVLRMNDRGEHTNLGLGGGVAGMMWKAVHSIDDE